MGSSTATCNDTPLHRPTLASILGINGPLRFRPHGSSQKPHVVLRRVQLSDDSSEDGESTTVVYFSLFASKRIEVKPGKEILLSIASADGSYENQALLLEGDLAQVEEERDVQEMDEDLPPLTEVIPPKMRRGWKARVDEGSENTASASTEMETPSCPPVAYTSTGVQAEPLCSTSSTQTEVTFAASSTQTEVACTSSSTQTEASTASVSVQAEPVSYAVATQVDAIAHVSASMQTVETRVFTTADIQTDPPLPSRSVSPIAPDHRERSLSPMELDSPSSSPPPSPSINASTVQLTETPPLQPPLPKHTANTPPLTMSPSQTDSSQPSAIFSPPVRSQGSPSRSLPSLSRESSIASSSGAQDMQVSPIEGKPLPRVSSPRGDEVPVVKPTPGDQLTSSQSSPRAAADVCATNLASSSHSIDSTPRSSPAPPTGVETLQDIKHNDLPARDSGPPDGLFQSSKRDIKAEDTEGHSLVVDVSNASRKRKRSITPSLPVITPPPRSMSPLGNPYTPSSSSIPSPGYMLGLSGIGPPMPLDFPFSTALGAPTPGDFRFLSLFEAPVPGDFRTSQMSDAVVPGGFDTSSTSDAPIAGGPYTMSTSSRSSSSTSQQPSTSNHDSFNAARPLSRTPISDLPKLSNFFVPASKAPTTPSSALPTAPSSAPPTAPSSATPTAPSASPPTAPSAAPPTAPARMPPTQPRLPPTQPQAMLAGRVRGGVAPLPPPDARSFAYIPTGPMSNPLGIRPSTRPAAPLGNGMMHRAPPTAPKSIAQSSMLAAPKMPGSLKSLSQTTSQSPASPANGSIATPQRKKLLLGTGWPIIRSSSGTTAENCSGNIGVSNSAASTPPSDRHSKAPTDMGFPAINTNAGLPYGPEPPPLPPPSYPNTTYPTPTTTSKWKPVNGAKAASVPGMPSPNTNQPLKPSSISKTPSQDNSTSAASIDPAVPPSPSPSNPLSLIDRLSSIPSSASATTPRKSAISEAPGSQARRAEIPRNLASRIAPAPGTTSPTSLQLPPPPPNKDAPPLPPSLPIISTSNLPTQTPSKQTPTSSPIVSGPKTPILGGPVPSPKISHPSVPPPMTHPLPPKPVGVTSRPPPRSMKRDRESPELPDNHKKRRRVFRWPTLDPSRMAKLKGDGDLGIKEINFNSDGSQFALCCSDRTVRIWSNQVHSASELARLSHNAPVVSVLWLTGDTGVVTLSEDGVVSKWIKTGPNHWQWAKILDAGNDRRADDDPLCLAYRGDRIAVSFPRLGVKVWIWAKGTWQPQRTIVRHHVTAIKFVDDGGALLGGTLDGVLWYCEIPNGTLRACSLLKSKITHIDLVAGASQALVAVVTGSCSLFCIQPDNKAKVEQVYSVKDIDHRTEFGAVFAAKDQAVLFGDIDGCVPVWDKKKAVVVYGLDHGEDAVIQAVASFDSNPGRDIVPCIITGTKQGHLYWWSQPASGPQSSSDDTARKRQKATP